jgi:adenosylmethionine-8-amino-7-oxononanoate aminotransferase
MMVETSLPARSLGDRARQHLWLHFAQHSAFADTEVPVITRGAGVHLYDERGRRYLDGLAGLFAVQVGHGREELARAAAEQSRALGYFPLWGHAHPPAVELAERIAGKAPGDLQRVFFTGGGGEAVETAWKLAKQYFRKTGQPQRHKVISRTLAYHGTSQGALSLTGIPAARADFEPLVPSAIKVPNTDFYRPPVHGDDYEAFGLWAAEEVGRAIEREGPETVAAVFLEPLQNVGGCLPPPPGYWRRVREICDELGVLLVSDEVICAFGRLGHDFGADRYGYQPDIITVAKGLTSGYAPLGAMIASERIMEPFLAEGASFAHGSTYGGHPVSCAVAMANLDLMEAEGLNEHVRAGEAGFRAALDGLRDLPIVGDVRGAGFFYGVELVKDPVTAEPFTAEDRERVLRGFVSPALFEAGLYCRADDRAEPVVQLAPPLIAQQQHFDEMTAILRDVFSRAWQKL